MTAMRISLTTRQTAFLVIGIILALYVLYQARFIILGPQISISYPKDATEVSEPLLVMTGTARNVARIELNGRQIFADREGHWSEKLLLSPGTSIMTVQARDRFGRETEKQVRIILISKSPNSPKQDDQEQKIESEGGEQVGE